MKHNIYCDESCYLEHDKFKYMVLGAIACPKDKRKSISNEIRNLKSKYGMNPFCEVKWKKVSHNKAKFYEELINYFFDNQYLCFRAVIVNKDELNHQKFNQTHDDFYYKMYYQLLNGIIYSNDENYIYLDIKDTKSSNKIKKLRDCLANGIYDFDLKHIKNVQTINSKESELLQLADILIGAISYFNEYPTKEHYNPTKLDIISLIKQKSGYSLTQSTFISENKFNIFFMELQK